MAEALEEAATATGIDNEVVVKKKKKEKIEFDDDHWDHWMVLDGYDEDEHTGTFRKVAPNDLKKELKSWLSGKSDTAKGHLTFLFFSPVDHCVQGCRPQYHLWAGPNTFEGNHNQPSNPDENFWEAVEFAVHLHAKEGRIWTQSVWEEHGPDQEFITQYPHMTEQEWRNPVFGLIQYEGEFFGFGLNQDKKWMNMHGVNADRPLISHARKKWKKKRGQELRFQSAKLRQAFKNGEIPGLSVSTSKQGYFKEFSAVSEVTAAALKEWVEETHETNKA